MTAGTVPKRIVMIDIARLYAMALVFYGHFIEELMLLKNTAAAGQYKFIYSFHMVLFIVLSGTIAKENVLEWGTGRFLKQRFISRLLPYIFFTFLMMIPPIFFQGKFYGLSLPSVQGYTGGLISTVFGLPSFDIPSWFLLLIFSVELVHFCVFRFLKDSTYKIVAAALIFYVGGYLLNLKLDLFNPLKGRTVGWNYLFLHEAITLYSFYLVGVLLTRLGLFRKVVSMKIVAPAAIGAFLAVLFTYRLNNGPFAFHVYDAVVILFSSHGNMLLFPLTALAGCAFVLLAASFTPALKPLVWLGQNTLLLMCLNGIFYHYLNPPLAKLVQTGIAPSGLGLLGIACTVTLVSLILCMPFVFAFNRYVPQLVGKPSLHKMDKAIL